MVLAAGTLAATAILVPAASAGQPRVQILKVGAISNDTVPVTLRCLVPNQVPCDLRVTVKSTSGDEVRTLGVRYVRLRANRTRLVWVSTSSSVQMMAKSCQPAVAPQAAGCVALPKYEVDVMGRAGSRTLPAMTRPMDGGPYQAPGLLRIGGSPSGRVLKLVYVSGNGCAGSPGVRLITQGKDEVQLDFVLSVQDPSEGACIQAFTPACVTVTLDKPLGRRAVFLPGKIPASPADLAKDELVMGFPVPETCPAAAGIVAN